MSKSAEDAEAAMTFREIGERLGITRQAAIQCYHRGIKKLRKENFETVWNMLQMSHDRQAMRQGPALPESE